jgi:hypothetical protein
VSYESRAYDNDQGDPVVVLVATGTHDVSRLVNLLAGSRLALCEHAHLSDRIKRQVNRYNGGREALKLLRAHGGPDLLEGPMAPSAEDEHTIRARVAKEARLAARELTDPAEVAILRWFADRTVAEASQPEGVAS